MVDGRICITEGSVLKNESYHSLHAYGNSPQRGEN